MIKTVIFDLNKVITIFDTSEEADKKYLSALGVTRQEFWKDIAENLDEYTCGKINLDQFISTQLKKSHLPEHKLEAAKLVHEDGLRIVEGITSLLGELSKKVKLILMAGEGKESLEIKLDKFNLRKYFFKIYASSHVKMRKTELAFYNLILHENNLVASEVLFVDDQLRYIAAAQTAGIQTILFKDISQLRKDLHAFKL